MCFVDKANGYKFKFRIRVIIKLCQKSNKVLEKIKKDLQLGNIFFNKRKNNKLNSFELIIANQDDVLLFINLVKPYLIRVLLSNYEEALKLFIPNLKIKSLNGCFNQPCGVIIKKMDEKKIGHYGSKPNLSNEFVNEQRVYGNRWGVEGFTKNVLKANHLRYTLTNFVRNWNIKYLSKQLNFNKFYSTLNTQSRLNPWFVSGLVDGEGSFSVGIIKNDKFKSGWRVQISFKVGLDVRDISLLLQLQQFWGGIGWITKENKTNMVRYCVTDIKSLTTIIIPHFLNYPLLSQKAADFLLFKDIIGLMNTGVHLSKEGLYQIINRKASMNLGISDDLKTEFNKFIPVERPLILTENIIDPQWIAGFTTAEGCFYVKVTKSTTHKIGYQVSLKFSITQHIRDYNLLNLIIKNLNAGVLEKRSNGLAVDLTITKFSDISKKIIPFFNINNVLGTKQLDYQDWCKVVNLMESGLHKTDEGLRSIINIKAGMNTGRKI
uniref:Homing endonuclease LAGLIDADG domain-containing protein n=1 Tax=Orbilia brochopaga TaxID=3140254 RepID=A0A4Y5MZS3_9PEZI|nr:hypothetical protein [Drechslerella brochopaga]